MDAGHTEILHAVKNWASSNGSDVLAEVPMDFGSAYADLVCVSKETATAFEFKSDKDSLRRFARQGWYYTVSFEKVALVVGSKLLGAATKMVPPHWGVMEFTSDSRELKTHRLASQNEWLEPEGLLRLFTHHELTEHFLDREPIAGSDTAELRIQIIESLSVEELKIRSRKALLQRAAQVK
jgi:hypothetical protein